MDNTDVRMRFFVVSVALLFGISCERTSNSPTTAPVASAVPAPRRLIPGMPYAAAFERNDSVKVGIIDSGVDTDNPQLDRLIIAYKDFTGEGMLDELGHGTLMSLAIVYSQWQLTKLLNDDPELRKTLLSEQGGLDRARISSLVVAKVCPRNGVITVKTVVRAIDWCVEQGCELINLSLAFPADAEDLPLLRSAIARHAQVLFQCAAGNFGENVPMYPASWATEDNNIIAVGSNGLESGKAEIQVDNDALPTTVGEFEYESQLFYEAIGRKDTRAARIHGKRALALREQRDIRFGVATTYVAESDWNAAGSQVDIILQQDPKDLQAIVLKGCIAAWSSQWKNAETEFRRALVLSPDSPEIHWNLAVVLLKQGRNEDAEAERQAAIRRGLGRTTADPRLPILEIYVDN